MKRVLWAFLGLVFLVGLVGCAEEIPLAEEKPAPEVVALQLTPAVEHWLPLVAECVEGIPNFGVYTQVLPRSDLSLAESDLILRLGERLESDTFVAIMGVEEVVIVAGEEVPVSSLSLEDLRAIYAGTKTLWGEVGEGGYGGSVTGQPITPLSYPVGHEVEILFRRAYLGDEITQVNLQEFMTIPFLENLLLRYPYAIGYLLKSQVPEEMQVIEILSDEPVPNRQYVLAVTAQEPFGGLKQLLLCLQNAQ
ncbi:MAG: hypothetical protein K0B06_07950 [Brevefilum sp.]|nr:hypothetical protein [Brevefilum sp.]